MRIIRLTASNVKRLTAVDIEPDGTLQVITGRNSQGKSSVLDAIWLALGGGAASRETAAPIRHGQDHASVTLDLGDVTVTRTWTPGKTALTVTAADGSRLKSPQAVLDALVGRLSFDPLAFTRLSAREQVAALLDIVKLDVDLPALAAQRERLYDQRTQTGRRAKALEGQVAGLGAAEAAPAVEVSAADLLGEIRAEQEEAMRQAADLRRRDELRADAERLEAELQRAWEALEALQTQIAGHRPVKDVHGLEASLAQVEDTNRVVRRNAERAKVAAALRAERKAYDALTGEIDDVDRAKADALAAAEFPVDGLGFDDQGVTYRGVPFSQASASEQIRVSLAMAMSLNPELRVIRIMDGSLLDPESMRLVAEMAAAGDYQVWVERVGDDSAAGVVIEDGAVLA